MQQLFKHDKWGLGAAVLAVAALGLTATMTLGGFSATITNSGSTYASGTLQLKEGQSATTCYSTGSGTGGTVNATNKNSTCAANVFGGAIKQSPGGAATTTVVKLTNVGNTKASGGTVVAGTCAALATTTNDNGYKGTDTSGFCAKVDVTIQLSSTPNKCLFPASTTAACGAPSNAGTLATLAGSTLTLPALTPYATGTGGTSLTVTVKAKLDTSAANADQGLKATLPITWSIHQ